MGDEGCFGVRSGGCGFLDGCKPKDGVKKLELCPLCTEGLTVIQKFVKKLEAKEKTKVQEFCGKIPILGEICKTFSDKVITLVENLDIKKTCTQIKACKA